MGKEIKIKLAQEKETRTSEERVQMGTDNGSESRSTRNQFNC